MGMIRKTISVSTLGLVDFRSDKERTARNTAKTARETKKIRLAKGSGKSPFAEN